MTYYILKLAIMLPLMVALIVGVLWLYRKYQPGMATGGGVRKRELRLLDSLSMGVAGRLAVVEFGEEKILIAATRGRVEKLASTPLTAADRERSEQVQTAGTVELPVSFKKLIDRAMAPGKRDGGEAQ